MATDAELKNTRMVLYDDKDIREMNAVLDRMLELTSAQQALLVDIEGHLITVRGGDSGRNLENISALVAGTFAATKETARLLGQDEFSVLFHQGQKDSIQLTLIGDRMLLGIIFDESTTIGMVRVYAGETAKRVVAILKVNRESRDDSSPLDEQFAEQAQEKLDDVFNL